jgi:hypothetical protein
MVDHNVMRLHVSVHNALAVAEVQRLKQLQDVEPHVDVVELGVQAAEVGVVDVLEDERRRLALRVPDHVEEGNNIGAPGQILQDLDLTLDLLLLDGLEHLDDAFLVVDDVDAFEDLGVLAAADLADDFVVLEDAPACRGVSGGSRGSALSASALQSPDSLMLTES